MASVNIYGIADDIAKDIADRVFKLNIALTKSPANIQKYTLKDMETLGYTDRVYPVLLSLEKQYLHNYDFGIELEDITSKKLGNLKDIVIYNVEKLPFRREYAHDRGGYFDPEEMSIDIPFWSIVADVCRDRMFVDRKELKDRLSKILKKLLLKAVSYTNSRAYFHKVKDQSHEYRRKYL